MKKSKILIVLLLGLMSPSVISCDKLFRREEKPTPISTPEPTPTPPNDYSKSLVVTSEGECDLGNKTLFELKNDGSFTYSYMERNIEKTNTVNLSENEFNSLKALLDKLDIANLAKNDGKFPEGTLQTKECRSVEKYKLLVNGNERIFDFNSRDVAHTSEYLEAIKTLKDNLDKLKSRKQPQIFPYNLPLKVTSFDECASKKTEKILYEITEDGNFSYPTTKDGAEDIVSRRLDQNEVSQVKFLFDDLLLAKLAEQDILFSRENPTSEQCRVIEYYYLNYNNKERIFGRNDRIAVHSREYNAALDKLKTQLDNLKKVKNK